ncbi:hypothetical protein [Asticcacaulis sp. W401b]|uniref:hypothetical protein n=1 Tax=Asticcacaulis sp. W401b TaxID=3388666 RepID=UPI003970A613
MITRKRLLQLMLGGSVFALSGCGGGGGGSGGTTPTPANPSTGTSLSFVDSSGIWKWRASSAEVALFGVNYCLPSAAAYRAMKASGASLTQTIKQDVAHFKRLGLDAIRLCFWGDWENSTLTGELIVNEHLTLLDFLVAEATSAGIYMLLSPIATYDANWPDNMSAPKAGFQSAFDRSVMGTDPNALKATTTYLDQLLKRINSITGKTYAAEPNIIAIEPVNEPWHHSNDVAGSIKYINALADAVRKAGSDRPVFHNLTQDMGMANPIRESTAEGATYAWYPTRLALGTEVETNGLLLVDTYPQFKDPRVSTKAKLVYEFDAAMSSVNYMFPAMARTFREGGAQWATMFTYDAWPIAAGNLEYTDHFLNLAYTPQKAISLMIAAQAFRTLPRGQSYGQYPASMSFGNTRVDDRLNLAEWRTDDTLIYTSDTVTTVSSPANLTKVIGCGSSAYADYDGLGAYFLEKLTDGAWRLEVYPDALMIDNPFDESMSKRPVSRVVWRQRNLRLSVPNLGPNFAFEKIDSVGTPGTASGGAFTVTPGVYLLRRDGSIAKPAANASYFAPPSENGAVSVVHRAPRPIRPGEIWTPEVAVVGATDPERVWIDIVWGGTGQIELTKGKGFTWSGSFNTSALPNGTVYYRVNVRVGGVTTAYPAAPSSYYTAVDKADAITLFESSRDWEKILTPTGNWADWGKVSVIWSGSTASSIFIDGTNVLYETGQDATCQFSWQGPVDLKEMAAGAFTKLNIDARSASGSPGKATVILLERDGLAWGKTLVLDTTIKTYTIALNDLVQAQAAMLPRAYPNAIAPAFLRPPENASSRTRVAVDNLIGVQVSIGTRFMSGGDATAMVEFKKVTLSV